MHIAEGGAGGAIREETVECIAEAAARRGEPIAVGQATSGAKTGGRKGAEAARFGPVAVGLDAKDERADLVIGSKCSAEQEAGGAEVASRAAGYAVGPVTAAEAVAAVDAEINAGPTEGGRRCFGGQPAAAERRGMPCPPAASVPRTPT